VNDRWRYLDPPAPRDGAGRYPIDEVLKAERWAWAGEFRGKRAQFFFDGIDFWERLHSGQRRTISRLDAPAHGWWHRPECNCAVCQGHVPAGRVKKSAAGRP
jgi:hypothetical protein